MQEFDFDTDSEDDEAIDLSAKSKQLDSPLKRIPTGSESESSFSEGSGSEDGGKKLKGKTTIANMEARSHAMDAEAAREAELDMQELQDAIAAGEMEGEDLEEIDGDEDEYHESGPSEPVKILTPAEREAEKKAGGPDVPTVQRRLRHCVRVLQNFKKLGKGRCELHIRVLVLSLIAHPPHPGQEPTTYLSCCQTSPVTTGIMSSWLRNCSICFQLARSDSWYPLFASY